jgi:hypothetical protein
LSFALGQGIFTEVLNNLQRCFAVYFVDVLLEISHPTLAAVVLDEYVDGGRIQHDVRVLESGSFLCLRAKKSLCNHRLLFRDVARDFDDFHPVQKRCRDGIEYIGYEPVSNESTTKGTKSLPVQTKRTRERSTGTSMLSM